MTNGERWPKKSRPDLRRATGHSTGAVKRLLVKEVAEKKIK